jgi:hypothetical protein
VAYFLPFDYGLYLFYTFTHAHSALCLASLCCTLATRGIFTRSRIIAMDRVRSTACYVGGAATGGSRGEGGGSDDRMESMRLSDVGSHGEAVDVADDGSHLWSFFFGPSTVTVNRVHRVIDSSYFAEGMGRKPREETVPEPNPDEAVVFEEFFTTGLRMPPDPVLSDIVLKFWVQIQQLMSNAIVQLSKYIRAVVSFGGVPSAEGLTKRYELHYQLRKIDVDEFEVQGQYGLPQLPCKMRESTSKSYCARKEQVVLSIDTGMVLLQSSFAPEPKPWVRQGYICSALAHGHIGFCDGATIRVQR